ncbi:MAG: ABC transporter ATP-binding protein [Rhodospirillaceae bacterium]
MKDNILKLLGSVLLVTSKVRLTTLLGLMVLGACLETMGVGLFLPLFAAISDSGSLLEKLPASLRPLLTSADTGALSVERIFLIICIVFLAKNITAIAVAYYQSRVIFYSQAEMQAGLVDHYIRKSYEFHLTRNSTNLIRNVLDSVPETFSAMMHLSGLMLEILQVVALAALLMATNFSTTAIVAAVVVTGTASILFAMRKVNERMGAEHHQIRQRVLQQATQGLGAIKEISVFGRQDVITANIGRLFNRRAQLDTLRETLHFIPRSILEILFIVTVVGVAVLALRSGVSQSELIPHLGLFAVAAIRMLPSANRIVLHLNGLRYAKAPIETVYDDLRDFRKPSKDGAAQTPPFPFADSLALDGVAYKYPASDDWVLRDVSLGIKRGETIGLVGPSGAGKSTIVETIIGVLTPGRGQVLVDGRPITDNIRGWQDQLGFVPQETFMFDDTVRANIAFGEAPERNDEARILNAVRLAGLEDVIAAMPDGLDTVIGERGTRLSGGQRQRVGIARALYNDPEVLVLDEATSSLDSETESAITEAIRSLHGKKTIIIIAHRLSTVRHCDTLFFVQGGRVVSEGPFEELCARSPEFRHLVELSAL